MVTKIRTKVTQLKPYFINPEERERVWSKAWGMWRHKKPDPIQVLKKLRKEWERNIG